LIYEIKVFKMAKNGDLEWNYKKFTKEKENKS